MLIFLPQNKTRFPSFCPAFAHLFPNLVFSSLSCLEQMLSLDFGKRSQNRPPQPGAYKCVDFHSQNAQQIHKYGSVHVGKNFSATGNVFQPLVDFKTRVGNAIHLFSTSTECTNIFYLNTAQNYIYGCFYAHKKGSLKF